MALVTIQMDRSITGYGSAGDVITVTQTAQTDAMIANGEAHTYSGPVTPTVVTLPISRSILSITTATTLAGVAGIDYVVLIGAGGVPTLPTAVGNTSQYTLKNTSGGAVTPAVTAAQTIDGAVPASLANNATLRVISDGANWRIL